MEWEDIYSGIQDARNTITAADRCIDQMANTIKGRLKHVSPYILAGLKRELRDFNMHTYKWKGR